MNSKPLYDFGTEWEVNKICIERTGPNRAISFSITFEQENVSKTLFFSNPDDPENIIELIDVERVLVSKDSNTQKEFGSIHVEFLGECYSELWCDTVELIHET